jgi:hypothetical protein
MNGTIVRRLGRAALAGGLCLSAATAALAQTPLTAVSLHQEVRVTDDRGGQVEGRVDALAADSLTVNGRLFTAARIARIERKGDRLWNGLIIGAGVGVFLPLLPTEACSNQSRGGCIASGIVTGALLGLAIDAVHRGYTTVYRAERRSTVRVVPRIDPHSRGVAVSLAF